MSQGTIFMRAFLQQLLTLGCDSIDCFFVLVLLLLCLLLCIRRNLSGARKNLKEPQGLEKKNGKKRAASHGYRSNESTDLDSDPAFVSSDTTSSSSSGRRAHRLSKMKSPPGSCAPSDVNPRNGQSMRTQSNDQRITDCYREVTSSRGNVPSSLEEVLKRRLERQSDPKTNLPASLQHVLGKLTSEDAAIVKAAFQAKATSGAFAQLPFSRAANTTEENSLRSNLRKLATVDSKRVFIVRKIGKLGLNSPELLKTYFSTFGIVEHVFVTHCVDRRNVDPDDPQATPVVRPAGVGFIVMEKADDVVCVFKQGLEHTVTGQSIALTAYQHFDPTDVMRNESKFGLQSDTETKLRGPRFPTYANITEDNTMKANLRKMAELDAKRIFMVRKINKLGLGSAQLLKTYFEQFGDVAHVFVTHSIDRRRMDQDPHARPAVRPAGIGFVVMDKPEDVDAIFGFGTEHTFYGVRICVGTYTHQIPDEAEAHENEEPSNEGS